MIIGLILFSRIAQKISELEAALQKKDEDMKAMEERYKMYLEKARNVSDPPAEQIFVPMFWSSLVQTQVCVWA